jgi:hypothetical protein
MLQIDIQDEILFVKLNRPEKRNAVNDALILEIDKVFSNIPKKVKCAIIHAEGKHFSAGLDLSELGERNIVEGLQHSRMWHRALEKVQFDSVPVVDSFTFTTIKPKAIHGQAPFIGVIIMMRGSLHHLQTRLYFSDENNQLDSLLNSIPEDRRNSLIANKLIKNNQAIYEFNIRMQGDNETVFFKI